MEVAVIALVVFVIGIFALFSFTSSLQKTADRWNRAFAIAAHRYNGDWTRGTWFRRPLMKMKYGQTTARLTVQKASGNAGPSYIEMAVHLPDNSGTRCEIGLRMSQRRLARWTMGLNEVEFDWSNFRDNWQVMVGDGDDAKVLLTHTVRVQIDQLWKFPFRSEAGVSLYPNGLVVRKVWDSLRPADLEAFVEGVFCLYDQLQLARTAGIEFVEGQGVTVIDDAQCRVCGEMLTTNIVICRRCKTPHHRDCWEYAGGCSTYGCRETVFQLPSAPLDPKQAAEPSRETERPFKPR